jgi:hypothetical protein
LHPRPDVQAHVQLVHWTIGAASLAAGSSNINSLVSCSTIHLAGILATDLMCWRRATCVGSYRSAGRPKRRQKADEAALSCAPGKLTCIDSCHLRFLVRNAKRRAGRRLRRLPFLVHMVNLTCIKSCHLRATCLVYAET